MENLILDLLQKIERDAARYRWLRQHPSYFSENELMMLTPGQYDDLIDQGMREAP